jgi:hypothetical protein
LNGDDSHGVDEFLAWHRKFIYDFETALRTIDPTITVPYWQWSLESRRPHQSIIWRRLGGSAGRSMGGMARCVPDGPFASWRMGYVADWAPDGDDGGCIYRSFDPRNGHNPDGYVTAQSCVDGLTRQARNFMEFNRGLVVAVSVPQLLLHPSD